MECGNFKLYKQCHADGRYSEALKFLFEAAENDNCSEAQVFLGSFYLTGDLNIPFDIKKSTEWYRKAAEANNPHGMVKYTGCTFGYEQEKWFATAMEKAFELHDYYTIGLCFKADTNILSYKKAVYYFMKSDSMFAQYESGDLLWAGEYPGVPQNKPESLKWFLKSAEQGFVLAQSRAGKILLEGDGVQKDTAKAAELLTKAMLQGNENSKKLFESLI